MKTLSMIVCLLKLASVFADMLVICVLLVWYGNLEKIFIYEDHVVEYYLQENKSQPPHNTSSLPRSSSRKLPKLSWLLFLVNPSIFLEADPSTWCFYTMRKMWMIKFKNPVDLSWCSPFSIADKKYPSNHVSFPCLIMKNCCKYRLR